MRHRHRHRHQGHRHHTSLFKKSTPVKDNILNLHLRILMNRTALGQELGYLSQTNTSGSALPPY